MAHPWKSVHDARSAASRTPVPEAISVVGGIAMLAEAPADPSDPTTPMVVTIGGQARTRVTGTPSAGQYRVRVSDTPVGPEWLPELELHASDEGLAGTADYYRTGTIVTALRWESLIAFCSPIMGLADQAALEVAYPPSVAPWAEARPGRIAVTDDGVVYYSTGAAWVPMAGGSPKWSGSRGDSLTAGATQDAAYQPAGSGAGSAEAAAVIGAAQDATFAGLNQTGDATAAATMAAAQDATYQAITYIRPANRDFEAAIGSTLVGDIGDVTNWRTYVVDGVAQRTTSNPITGTGSGYLKGNSGGTASDARLIARFTKAYLDTTNGLWRFNVKRIAQGPGTGEGAIAVYGFDSGGTLITNVTSGAQNVRMWGDSLSGTAANTALLNFAPVNGTIYSKSFDLKAFLQSLGVYANVVDVRVDVCAFGQTEFVFDDAE
jgi:hypothetical protein